MIKNKFFRFPIYLLIVLSSALLLSACQTKPNTENEQPSAQTETPQQEQVKIEILDGNIVKTNQDGQLVTLINKTDVEGIEEFTEVKLSPDGSKICFLGQSIVPIWMFYANADGTNINKIAVAKNCVWSPDSQKIAFNNHTTDVSPVNVLVYFIGKDETKNLTANIQQDNLFRIYQTPEWPKDSKQIFAKYTIFNFDDFSDKGTGESIINIETGNIIEKS